MDGIEQCQAEIRRLRSVIRELVSVAEPLSEIMISIANGNSDFVCSDCLRTIDVLKDVLRVLNSDFAKPVIEEVNEILGDRG